MKISIHTDNGELLGEFTVDSEDADKPATWVKLTEKLEDKAREALDYPKVR